jgi:exoribonuclease R
MSTSQQYRVHIDDRDYKSWSFVDPETNIPKQLSESESLINPATLKLFSEDLVDLSMPIPTILRSPARSNLIPGVLILTENQTYGRTANAKRLLYKCIPDNPNLPNFLVPYSPDINFLKTQKNRYVVFRFDNWQSKYPHGILIENLGNTDHLPAFYEYQLYCRQIHSNISEFTNNAKNLIKQMPVLKQQNSHFFQEPFQTHQMPRVFSIDPEGAKDFDDAFSVMMISPFVATVSIHIANVYAWMETLNLWSSFGERISTIYLPDSKRSMLPSILSDSICSLVADKTAKPTFCMELNIDINKPLILPGSIRFLNQPVKIDKNYVYESKELLKDSDYQLLHRCTKLLDPNIQDSHDVVAYWMIQMNSICGNRLNQKGVGIFREVSMNREEDPDIPIYKLPLNTKNVLQNWKNTTGTYKAFDSNNTILHSAMKKESYVHITSPIRRLVDLLNQISFQKEFGLVERISDDANFFLNYWQSKLSEINMKMRATRKVQIDCDLLCRCTAHPEWMQHPHRGVIFDRFERPDGSYSYMVHLSELNILGRVVTQEKYVNYSLLDFKLFVFQDSDKIHRKIRLAVFA